MLSPLLLVNDDSLVNATMVPRRGPGELHTTRWRIVMSVAQSQAQGAQAALAALRRRALACDQTQQRSNQWTSSR